MTRSRATKRLQQERHGPPLKATHHSRRRGLRLSRPQILLLLSPLVQRHRLRKTHRNPLFQQRISTFPHPCRLQDRTPPMGSTRPHPSRLYPHLRQGPAVARLQHLHLHSLRSPLLRVVLRFPLRGLARNQSMPWRRLCRHLPPCRRLHSSSSSSLLGKGKVRMQGRRQRLWRVDVRVRVEAVRQCPELHRRTGGSTFRNSWTR